MSGLFCSSKANTNEEYRKIIKTRMSIMILVFMIGCMTLAIALLAKSVGEVTISERMLGVYTGIGTGLMIASVILWIKNKILLGDDGKLKRSRLSHTDERIQEINMKAFKVATIILILALYAVGLIGGLFYPILVELILCLVGVFLLAYVIAYKGYEKRM